MITTTWRCKSLRLIGGKSRERLDSRRPRHPPSPRQRRTLRRRGLPKNPLAQCADCEKYCKKYKGARRKNCPDFHVKLQPKNLLCTLLSVCMPSWRRSLGTQREVQFHQQNQQNACHCHGEDESGHFLFGHVDRKKREST